MSNWMQRAAAAAVMCWGTASAWAGTLPGPIVDSAWLAANLDKVQVVDVRGNVKSFTAAPEIETDAKSGKKTVVEVGGHVPGAVLVNAKNMRVERKMGDMTVKYMIPDQAGFEKFAQDSGVVADKPIVLVPVGLEVADVDDVLRMYWQFKVYGEDNVAVLDGGMANWLAEGRAFSTDAAAGKVGNWKSKADRTAQYFASSADVAKALGDKKVALIDARDARQFHGLTKRDYVGAFGHLEGAKLYEPDLVTKTSNGSARFLNANTYRALMQAKGIDPAAASISYCNSGHLSSGPWFIMSEVLGAPNAKLYDGSLHQWTMEKQALSGAVPQQ